MDAYTGFAQVYDLFMDNVPYDEWCAYICETLKKHGIADGPVLDLGCGTGELTRRLAACGYDMTGVDVSVDMLQKAMEKQTDPPAAGGEHPPRRRLRHPPPDAGGRGRDVPHLPARRRPAAGGAAL